jgi:hypothetical protein
VEQERSKEEVDQRAQELARRLMSKPYEKQEWPKKPRTNPRAARSSASSAQKPRSTGGAS